MLLEVQRVLCFLVELAGGEEMSDGCKQFSPTSPTKYCFCLRVFNRLQEGFQGRLDRPEKWGAWVRVCRTHRRSWSRPFFFRKYVVFFYYRLLLTRKWKLVEVFMTVVMYRSQQHGRRGQRIDTRKPESGIVLTWLMGEARCFFSCSWQENLMVSAGFLSLWSPR